MEENREGFGEDIDIEGLAAALGDTEGSDAQKDIPLAETPVFIDEPAIPAERPVFSDDPPAPYEPAGSALSDGASADSSSGAAGGDDAGSRSSAVQTPGESKDQEGGDIDALIKKYEEIPSGKKEIAKTKKPGGGKALPVAPIAAAVGAIVIIALLKFVVFKSAPAVQKVQPGQTPSKAAAAPALAGAQAEATAVDYPGGAVLMGETKDGIEIKIIETDAATRDIKLFYQKNMAEKGFEISASRKSRSTFNMKFFKGQEDYSVSVVPHAEKNLIIVTRAK
ncbi:MAG: hypothetical protein ABII20_06590 [Candidatus Omnitrophota bacterium]|nr:hypothetical protein [Candidatus Omnitrophota bacterium]MBU2529233.1 hypothetical protein [bacterium]MBU3930507.1 hypothetical protein [bacterium]MBU4122271.1 hypothetical protein [bacterium]